MTIPPNRARIELETQSHMATVLKKAVEIALSEASKHPGRSRVKLKYLGRAEAYQELWTWLIEGTPTGPILPRIDQEANPQE